MGPLGPAEGWLVKWGGVVGIVKGCEHPLPGLTFAPRLVRGRRVKPSGPRDLCDTGVPCRVHPCLGVPAPIAPPEAKLESPFEAAARLRGCSSPGCRAALALLEHMASAGVEAAGVTGSLAYAPEVARDADIVVYGPADAERAYRLLADLRADGVTQPLEAPDEPWGGGLEATLGRRLLVGRLGGVAYTVRLVACTRPTRCLRVRRLGFVRACGTLRHAGPSWLTPTVYELDAPGRRLLVYTLRLRYAELPDGARVCVEGVLEEVCGLERLVPDWGGVSLVVDEAR